MKWYNFKALSVNTALDSKSLIPSDILENFVNDLQANTTLYHCYYDLEQRPSFVDYDGLLKPVFDTLHIDLDSDDGGVQSWNDTKALGKKLAENNVPFHVYFSGNKGFHVAIHTSSIGMTQGPKAEIELQVKSLLQGLKLEFGTVDLRIWNANRKFRAFRSKHEKSGLYKIRLTDIGIKSSELSIDAIRNLALKQQEISYSHPEPVDSPSAWLTGLIQSGSSQTTNPASGKKSSVKEVSQGSKIEDDSFKFRNYKSKACIRTMEDTQLPQFNRHDVGLRLMCDFWAQGLTLEAATARIEKWATNVFAGDRDRVSDTVRQVKAVYSRPQDYQFSCYDDIKQAYCSAKCKLYDQLDRKKRAEPVDTSTKQKKENRVRENDNLELSEGQIADRILAGLPELCKVAGQYFQWKLTHWERIDGNKFEDSIKKAAIAAYQNEAPIRMVENLAKHILTKIPMAPDTNHFFTSSPTKFNFTDYTAEVVADIKGNLNLVTRPHDKKDYLASCAPFPLIAPHTLKRGSEFRKYLETRRGDVGDEGIRIIKQMLGAALIPYAPRIFFIEGITNAGKSTLALLIKRLLGQENVAEVQPVIHGNGSDRFNWEPSIGKLANIVLELDERKPLDTTVLKMVRDKAAVSVDRKGKQHIQATLPFFHVYCCNAMPPSLEGNSGALNNRVTMLHFKPGYLNGSSGVVEYADHIWNDDAGGVLEIAREGLADLMESGFRYHVSETSKESVKDWQERNDSVKLWLKDVQSGEYQIASLEGKEWELGKSLYIGFTKWCEESGKRQIGKHLFYEQLSSKLGWQKNPRAEGGVRFKVSGIGKREYEQKPNQNSSIVSDTQAF